MRQMKDIGLDIIEYVPLNWKVKRLKYFCTIETGNQDTQNSDPDAEYPFYVRSPIIERCSKYTFDGEGILIAGDGAGAGRIFHHAYGKYAVHQRVYRLANFYGIDSSFLFYYLSALFNKQMDKGSAQSTVPSVRLPMLTNFPVIHPATIDEQNIIATFLDRKCSEIDALVTDIQNEIETLGEYKRSIITEAVTKGLNPDVEMKDSGVEFIGDIPIHWEIRRIKSLGTFRNGLTYNPNDLCDENNGILVLRSSNVKDGKISFTDNLYVSCKVPSDLIVKDGDILICSRNGSRELVGKCAIIENIHATFGAFMMIFRCEFPRYLYYALNSDIFKYYLSSFFTSTINQLTGLNFGNMKIAFCPNKIEREKIIEYLDYKCSEIENIISEKKQQIATLEEYKKSLIYECVTGKKEVVL